MDSTSIFRPGAFTGSRSSCGGGGMLAPLRMSPALISPGCIGRQVNDPGATGAFHVGAGACWPVHECPPLLIRLQLFVRQRPYVRRAPDTVLQQRALVDE